MKLIWTKSKPEFQGEFVKFGPMMTWPKPIQKPHPPVIVGGGLPYGARRALAFGDEWMPHARRPNYRLLDRLDEWKVLEKAAGRTLPITAHGVEHDADLWPRYRDGGCARIVVSVESEPADTLLPKLDAWAKGVAAVAA
jgi:alkanesulfonate monooxygenase SsuD/methylene tetrahydromethanopterin reductase-like flavin-dependent oxidoreductase (luciferase family)